MDTCFYCFAELGFYLFIYLETGSCSIAQAGMQSKNGIKNLFYGDNCTYQQRQEGIREGNNKQPTNISFKSVKCYANAEE